MGTSDTSSTSWNGIDAAATSIAAQRRPIWSHDSKSIVFAADRHGPKTDLRNADGPVRSVKWCPRKRPTCGGSFTPDGRSRVFLQAQSRTNYESCSAYRQERSAGRLGGKKARELAAHLAGGRWLEYTPRGRYVSRCISQADGQGRRKVSRDGGSAGDAQETARSCI